MRQTEVIGTSNDQVQNLVTWPPLDELQNQLLKEPAKTFQLSRVDFMTGWHFGCLRFGFKNARMTPKFGDYYQIKSSVSLREAEITKITVLTCNKYPIGLVFSYADGETQEIKADYSENDGPVVPFELPVQPGEFIAGVTVESDANVPTRIGFTLLKI